MSETDANAKIHESEEVAPGLVMEMTRTHEPDGRYLIYYNFRTAAGEGTAPTSEAAPGIASAALPGDR